MLMKRCQIEEFLNMNTVIIDVRTPSEYNQGHWPGALNLPIFTDKERVEIGTIYKKQGSDTAIQLGLKIVEPKLDSIVKQIEIWNARRCNYLLSGNQTIRIYCWRGGMRSSSMAWLVGILGYTGIVLQGGYKTFRYWVLSQFRLSWPLHLIGGRTGTGKTDLLLAFESHGKYILDLEGLAQHRGSSFGNIGLPAQPSTEHYENLLSMHLYDASIARTIWLEGESTQIGTCRIPIALWKQMQKANLLEIQRPVNYRIRQLMMTYGPFTRSKLKEATSRISRRLGPKRTQLAFEAINEGCLIDTCLQILDYYDHCYDFELKRSPQRQSLDLGQQTAKQAVQELIKHGVLTSNDRGRHLCVGTLRSDFGSEPMAAIQFFRGVDETVLPDIRVTRSRDGRTGQATFRFEKPVALAPETLVDITGMFMIDEEGELVTREVKASFVNGKPSALEATYTWKSESDFERFMRFAQRYADSNGLGYSGKNDSPSSND
uniref:Photosystem II reaction center Psb28 protein n=1 Tax=Paulinella micropora TaxID=1928728 RepID=A0A1L5YBH8_9EUKA|nr:hypothetical protein PCKR_239 [Paulinella micropora]